jgi:EAL domain-containing protein (putative c-di-GMP-specific phosphodiesterase class I)
MNRDTLTLEQRRQQRLLQVALLLSLAVLLQGLLRHALQGRQEALALDLGGLLLLLPVAWLLQRRRLLAASLAFLLGMAAFVALLAMVLDRPSAAVPRFSHLYLLPLMLLGYQLLRDRPALLRRGSMLLLVALYVLLAMLPAFDLPAPPSVPAQRLAGLLNGLIVIALLIGLAQLGDTGWIEQTELEIALARAIANGRLTLALQPQCDAAGRVLGAEALVRWQDAERGWVSPAEFVPLAEARGLILPLGEQVLAQALALLQRWRDDAQLGQLPLAVNLSALQLQDDAHLERLLERVAAQGLPRGRLKFELTESVMVAEPERMRLLLERCRAQGIATALDDFGTGYASLATLSQLPFEQLKIDQHFVRQLPGNPRAQKVARSLVELGERLGLDVIAEGVETAEHVALLRGMGVAQFQGYHFARPLPPAEFEAWCREHAA